MQIISKVASILKKMRGKEEMADWWRLKINTELERKYGGLRISTKQLATCFVSLKKAFSIKRKIYYVGGNSQTSRVIFYSVKRGGK